MFDDIEAPIHDKGLGLSKHPNLLNEVHHEHGFHEVREFAGHSDIRTTEIYFVRKEEDGEIAARKIQIRLSGRKSE